MDPLHSRGVDELPHGGTCTLRGCDPEKILELLVATGVCSYLSELFLELPTSPRPRTIAGVTVAVFTMTLGDDASSQLSKTNLFRSRTGRPARGAGTFDR